MGGAKQLLEEIEALEARLEDPRTLELNGEDVASMHKARAAMISRLHDMNEDFRPVGTNSQRDAFRAAAHSAGVEAAGVRGPVLFGLGGDRAASSALARDGETVDADHIEDLRALYGDEAANHVAETVQQLETIDGIKRESSAMLEDPTDYAHRTTSR